jgi:hypothetical protein
VPSALVWSSALSQKNSVTELIDALSHRCLFIVSSRLCGDYGNTSKGFAVSVVGLVVGRSQLSSGSSGELLATTCTAFVAVFLLTLFVVGGFWFRFSSASYSFAVLADVCVGCLFWLWIDQRRVCCFCFLTTWLLPLWCAFL